jgi:hypothetical protein
MEESVNSIVRLRVNNTVTGLKQEQVKASTSINMDEPIVLDDDEEVCLKESQFKKSFKESQMQLLSSINKIISTSTSTSHSSQKRVYTSDKKEGG